VPTSPTFRPRTVERATHRRGAPTPAAILLTLALLALGLAAGPSRSAATTAAQAATPATGVPSSPYAVPANERLQASSFAPAVPATQAAQAPSATLTKAATKADAALSSAPAVPAVPAPQTAQAPSSAPAVPADPAPQIVQAPSAAPAVPATQAAQAPSSTPPLGQPDLSGHWEGAVELPQGKLAFEVDFQRRPAEPARPGGASGGGGAGEWKGSVSIPAQGAKDRPLAHITSAGGAVHFEIPGIPGLPTFDGRWSADGQSIAGDFTQGGAALKFSLARAARPAEAARSALAGFDTLVAGALPSFDAPGAAVAVVKNGEVIFAQGFGYRDREKKLPVTADTLFAIGSCTKAFTTFVMGTLVDEGKLDWDKPVREYIPEFALRDPVASEQLTPRDMVSHRSGLPRHDLVWYNNLSASRADLVARLRYLEPNQPLRAKWQYNNLMFLAAGYLVERVTGQTWEDNVRQRILDPLGMGHTTLSVEGSQRSDDFAQPYDERKGSLVRIPFRPITNMGPAGAINSSAADMAKWLILQLGDGALGGRRLIARATLDEIHAPQMVVGTPSDRPDVSPPLYAMGWLTDIYRGHLRVLHDGNIDGFSAGVTLFPQDGIGFVVLVNQSDSLLPAALARLAADRLLALPPVDWLAEGRARLQQGRALERESRATQGTARHPGTHPAHPLPDYAGSYRNSGYGPLVVTLRGDRLEAVYNGLVTPLDPWHYETWSGADTADPILRGMKFTFRTDRDGEVAALEAPFEQQVPDIVFAREPAPRLSDPAWLRRLAGTYDLKGAPITVAVAPGAAGLLLSVPGQPLYHLQPALGDRYLIKEIPAISVTFSLDPQGNVTALTVHQPEGPFSATRKS
jgi:CubicO group peptidase (beta-lactamase class C family)